MKTTLALSLLCENPLKLTGLTSLFREFVSRSLERDPGLDWVVFLGPEHDFDFEHARLKLIRDYPGNNVLKKRLAADHLFVSPRARSLGAELLLTIGFVPARQSIPTVMHLLTLHHLDPSNQVDPLRTFYRKWAVRKGLRKAKLVVTNSRVAAGRILNEAPSVQERLLQSYEGLDHSSYYPRNGADLDQGIRDFIGAPADYILWLSNLYSYKQAHLLVEAYARLPEALRARYPIVWVGGDWHGQKDAVRELASQRGVADRMVFPGWVEDDWIVPILQHARLLVLPSREETFGRCVAEAMACGVPCVVNDIPIMHEVTQGAGWIVRFDDSREAAAALEEALTNPSMRQEAINRGLHRAKTFDFDKLTSERMERVYGLLGRKFPGEA